MLRRGLCLILIAVLAAIAGVAPARAADIVVDTSQHRPMIFLSGEIVEGDAEKFNKAAGDLKDAWVVLSSPGGLIFEGLEIGKSINLRGFSTVVPNEFLCASACAMIWVAGTTRYLAKSGRVGFHASFKIEKNGEPHEVGISNAAMGRYLTLLGLPERAVVLMTAAGPTTANWLTAYNYQYFGIDVTVLPDLDYSDKRQVKKAVPPPTNKVTPVDNRNVAGEVKLETKAAAFATVQGWQILRDDSIGGSCFAARIFPNESIFRIGFNMILQRIYVTFGNFRWQSLIEGRAYPITIQFDDHAPWSIDATVMRLGPYGAHGPRVLTATMPKAQIFGEFRSSRHIVMRYNGADAMVADLPATEDAAQAMIRCQEQSDPFVKGGDGKKR